MVISDTLSRAPIDLHNKSLTVYAEDVAALADYDNQMSELRLVASERTIKEITAAAAADEQYGLLIHQIKVGWSESADDVQQICANSDQLSVSNDLIFKGHRVVIPRGYRQSILDRIHSSHIGINGCIRRAREAVFYPGITGDIKQMVSACTICQTFCGENQKETLLSHAPPMRPFEKIEVDIFTLQRSAIFSHCAAICPDISK
jgi:hypothetical protein